MKKKKNVTQYIAKLGCEEKRKIKKAARGLADKIISSGKKPVIVNIGTDRCIGDSLAPLVGTLLKDTKIKITSYGDLDYPIHAVNMQDRINKINEEHKDSFIIAIDACLGTTENNGSIIICNGPLSPGKGIGKDLPKVGDVSIKGIIGKRDEDDVPFLLHNIRLSMVMNMSKAIVNILKETNKILNNSSICQIENVMEG